MLEKDNKRTAEEEKITTRKTIKIPKIISKHEEKILREKLRTRRDKLIFDILLYTGLRANEVANIKKSDIDYRNDTIKVIGKGNKERIVPMNEELIISLSNHIKRKKIATEYLLTSNFNKPMSANTLYKIIKRLGNRAGMKLHPHMFRHTFCTRLMDKGIPVEKIAVLAGHTDPKTTMIYAKVTTSQKHEAVAKLQKKRSWFKNMNRRKEIISNAVIENYEKNEVDIHRTERKNLNSLFQQRISTCLLEPPGIGKTHELRYLKKKENVVWIAELKNKTDFKRLIGILDEKKIFTNLEDKENKINKALKGSIKDMIDIIPIEIISEYVFIIDDVALSSKQIRKYLIELKTKACLICSYHKNDEFANEFRIVELAPLRRIEVSNILKGNYPDMHERKHLEMLDLIFNKSMGFPRRVHELIERYKKSGENIIFLRDDRSIETVQTKSLGFVFLLFILVMVVFSLKLSTQGIFVTAAIYVILILARLFFYRYSSRF